VLFRSLRREKKGGVRPNQRECLNYLLIVAWLTTWSDAMELPPHRRAELMSLISQELLLLLQKHESVPCLTDEEILFIRSVAFERKQNGKADHDKLS